ncbi:hypothetical protein [Croceivirga thetidis]|uniref:Uncharacterized protein n=1 Tax=Croceivirga thetidis TaxID=2721623 RepID=A0ABX1GNZ8_9FLAO|nr:hypothetical protein [Croceivirga thetidis]NKI30492.1 hypothetical protein [Croceivirga thetidis]
MKKCLLLFFFLLVSIFLLKFSESADSEADKATVEQLVDDAKEDRIARY